METGIVKWFDSEKGYGFVTPEAGGQDLFVHSSGIDPTSGVRALAAGQRVRYEKKDGPKGLQAVNVMGL